MAGVAPSPDDSPGAGGLLPPSFPADEELPAVLRPKTDGSKTTEDRQKRPPQPQQLAQSFPISDNLPLSNTASDAGSKNISAPQNQEGPQPREESYRDPSALPPPQSSLLNTSVRTSPSPPLKDFNCAIALVHSRLWFLANSIILIVVIGMLVWISIDQNHYVNSPVFEALEFFLVIVMSITLIVEIRFKGWRYFWPKVDAPASILSRAKRKALQLFNWSQVMLLIASICLFVFYLCGPSSQDVIESELVLGVFLLRYVLYCTCVVLVQFRACDILQFSITLKKESFKGGHDEWDVHFEEDGANEVIEWAGSSPSQA